MKTEGPTVYWDSVVFIARIQREAGRIAVLEQISDAAERGELRIVTSTFTMVEVAKLNQSETLPEEQERLIVEFFKNSFIILRQVDRRVATKAREIMRAHSGVKGKDAVHIATAVVWNVPVMHTYDEKLTSRNGKIDGLRIEEPRWTGTGSLLFASETP